MNHGFAIICLLLFTVALNAGDKDAKAQDSSKGKQAQAIFNKIKSLQGDKKNTLLFNFVTATNLKSKNDPHLHNGKLEFLGENSSRSTWTKYVDGKAAEKHSFEMTRKKKASTKAK